MLYAAQIYKYIDISQNLTNLIVFEEASNIFPEERLCETAVVESVVNTV